MTTSSLKPGLTAPQVLSIPKEWSREWFRSFITNFLQNADVRNASGVGIAITGNPVTPATLALGSVAPGTVLGNAGGSTSAPIALSRAQLTSLINVFTAALAGDVPPSGGGSTNFLRADGTWAAPPGGGGSGSIGPPGMMGDDGQDGEIGPPGPQGIQGITGGTGAQGPAVFLEAEPGEDAVSIPGPPGAAGAAGSPGSQGASGPAIFFESEANEDSLMIPGPTGPQGAAGQAGSTGGQGSPGPAVIFEAETNEDALLIPGPAGAAGQAGATGNQGPSGPAIVFEAEANEDAIQIPGPQGNPGTTGAPGPLGPGVVFEAEMPEDQLFIQGPQGNPASPLGASGNLTSVTTINDNATPTTGGITLTQQTAQVGAVWRIKAYGSFVAVSSATARNAQIAAFWGSTALTTVSVAVLVSTSQTTNWELEMVLSASSTTAVWATGTFDNELGSATLQVRTRLTPASTTVTAGAQTIDLRFSMSVAVATDQWLVDSVTIERLK